MRDCVIGFFPLSLYLCKKTQAAIELHCRCIRPIPTAGIFTSDIFLNDNENKNDYLFVQENLKLKDFCELNKN